MCVVVSTRQQGHHHQHNPGKLGVSVRGHASQTGRPRRPREEDREGGGRGGGGRGGGLYAEGQEETGKREKMKKCVASRFLADLCVCVCVCVCVYPIVFLSTLESII